MKTAFRLICAPTLSPYGTDASQEVSVLGPVVDAFGSDFFCCNVKRGLSRARPGLYQLSWQWVSAKVGRIENPCYPIVQTLSAVDCFQFVWEPVSVLDDGVCPQQAHGGRKL